MKVLVFTSQFYLIGGYERLAVELAVELNKLGIHTDLLSQLSKDIPGAVKAELQLLTAGVPKISYLGLRIHPNLLAIFSAIYRFRKLIRTEAYTAVEVSGFTPALIASVALTGMETKVLIGVHDIYTAETYGGFKYIVWKLILKHSRHVSFFAISEAVANAWIKYVGIKSQGIKVVLNSINSQFLSGKEVKNAKRNPLAKITGASSGAKFILFTGRLMRRKGIDTLYCALKSHLVLLNLHLVIIGRADDSETARDAELLREIQDEILISPWRDRVHFLGLRSDVYELMVASDVLVHPARIEGFGLVLAEALAAGLPIVASNVDGIPEVLSETDSVMVAPDDVEALATAAISVLNWSKEKRSAAVNKGLRRAVTFSPEKRAKAIMELLIK